MSDGLSQAQIDALLNSMKQGEPPPEAGSEKKVKKYDFHSPKRFTKDRLKLLDSIYENFARITSSYFSSLLRVPCEITMLDVEEQRYFEFNNALTDSDILGVYSISTGTTELDPLLVHMSNEVVFYMMDRMMGGGGDEGDTADSFTDIELVIYESVLEQLSPIIRDTFNNYLEIDSSLNRLQTNPMLFQDIGMDDTVVIVVLNMKIRGVEGKINISLPADLLDNMFKHLDRNANTARRRGTVEYSGDEILDTLKWSELEIEARLGDTELLLSDMYNMQVGDIINLNKPKDSDVYLYIGDKPWFRGTLGIHKHNMAIKIIGALSEEQQESMQEAV